MLIEVADAGTVEIDHPENGRNGRHHDRQTGGVAGRLLGRLRPESPPMPRLLVGTEDPTEDDLATLAAVGRLDLLAGEVELEWCRGAAVTRGEVAAVAGWMPAAEEPALADRLGAIGAGVVPLPRPRGVDPPTLLRSGGRVRQSFSPLVETYATVPYADIDPTVLAGLAYVTMFGVMFGDVGHGALLVCAGLLLRSTGVRRLSSLQRLWPFVTGAGLASILAGLLYGEFFGPTGVIPVVWLAPLEEPVTMLGAALGLGAVLLGAAYALGTVNRWREGGWPLALSAPSGVGGVALFAGLGLIVLGAGADFAWVVWCGVATMAAGMVLAYVGFLAGAGGGAAGVTQATVELFDTTLRLGTSLVSFARLALRLEYYELFSRVFRVEGRPFRPWHVPVDRSPGSSHAARSGSVINERATS
jgi:V/A-type H+-transporting ATPase subunit I